MTAAGRLRAAAWVAFGYCVVAFALLVTAGRVATSGIQLTYWYPHATDLRLVMSFVNGTLFLCAAAALSCEVYLSKNDSAGISTTAVAMVHCVGIATATTMCGVIGRTGPSLVYNQANPRLVVSLDVLITLWLGSYVLHSERASSGPSGTPTRPLPPRTPTRPLPPPRVFAVLRELFGGLVPPGTAAERGHPAVAAWRRLVIETRAGAWAELACITIGAVMLGVSRLLTDRSAAAAAFAVWVCVSVPPLLSSLLLAFDAYQFCGHQPLVRYCGLAFVAVIVPTYASVLVIEALYQVRAGRGGHDREAGGTGAPSLPQFSNALPAATGVLYADSVLCTSLLPYALAVLTCNTMISSASRMELYQARLVASALHVRAR